MDRFDEALYSAGSQKAAQAGLDERKEHILSLSRMGKRKCTLRRVYFGAAAAALLVIGLAAGAFAERTDLFGRAPVRAGIPPTDGEIGGPRAQPTAQWDEVYFEDIRLEAASLPTDVESIRLGYIPEGMTAEKDDAYGLLALSDGARTRSILARPCLRYELFSGEYDGLETGYARARVKISENGDTGGISWILRLSEDVYFYVSVEGLSYEDSLLFIKGIQQAEEGG